ncbi:hypothetical protein AC1031_020478 [Aphanomyces cochlioides]|nr:hypothetical protein AC1031_020478 [Aphanomyces cochlioides]
MIDVKSSDGVADDKSKGVTAFVASFSTAGSKNQALSVPSNLEHRRRRVRFRRYILDRCNVAIKSIPSLTLDFIMQLATLFLVAHALLAAVEASIAQRADPNAIQTCTNSVQLIQSKALANPAAVTCAKSVPEVAAGGDTSKGLSSLGKDAIPAATISKLVASTDCASWYSSMASTIVSISPACDFTYGTSTLNTAKYNATFTAFLAAANTGTGTALSSATTTTPTTTSATTAAPTTTSSTSSKTTTQPTTTAAATKSTTTPKTISAASTTIVASAALVIVAAFL